MTLATLSERFRWRNEYLIALMPALFLFSRAAADSLVIIIGLAFIYRSYRMAEWGWTRRPWFVAALVLWIGLIIGVTPLSVDPGTSLLHSFGFIRWPLFAAAMAYWILKDVTRRSIFEWSVVALVFFIIVDTAIQYFTGVDLLGHQVPENAVRLTGPFNKLVPGAYTVGIFFIALAVLYFSGIFRSERARLLMTVAALAIGVGFVFITGERGAFLSIMLGSVIVSAGLFWSLKGQRLFMIAALIAFFIGVSLFAVSQERMVNRTLVSTVHYIKDWPNSPSGHSILPALEIWKMSGSPIFGLGIKTYKSECVKTVYDKVDKFYMNPRYCSHPHNIYVEWLVGAGLLGLGGFLIMLVLIFREILYGLPPGHKTMPIAFVLAMLMVVFWPIKGSMSFFSNGIAAIIWMQIGWAMAWMAAWRKVG